MRKETFLTQFTDLGLAQSLLKALEAEGYKTPTPIQAQAIPHLLAGRDLLGIAQTGTGKTAAFALPILHKLAADRRPAARKTCRALVLSPTRELASQIADSFRTYGKHLGFSVATVFGGVGHKPQIDKIMRGVDILVATPGRLIDHIDSRVLSLGQTEVFVLDEADQMLDMGFIHALRKIVPLLPAKRQSLFFSATMPREMADLAGSLLTDPVKVAVAPVATTAERVAQRVIFVETAGKRKLLADVIGAEKPGRTLVFTRTKHGADRVVKQLALDGIAAVAIHGNKSQGQREKALAGFRSGATPILVATDIAARGIDVDAVTHVINFDLPNVPESYVHRIGRTARAGAEGIAISFCDGEERAYLRDIEKLTRQQIAATDAAGNPVERRTEEALSRPASRKPQGRSGGRGNGGQQRGGPARNGQPKRRDEQPRDHAGGQQRRGSGGGSESISGMGFMQPSGGRRDGGRNGRRRDGANAG